MQGKHPDTKLFNKNWLDSQPTRNFLFFCRYHITSGYRWGLCFSVFCFLYCAMYTVLRYCLMSFRCFVVKAFQFVFDSWVYTWLWFLSLFFFIHCKIMSEFRIYKKMFQDITTLAPDFIPYVCLYLAWYAFSFWILINFINVKPM